MKGLIIAAVCLCLLAGCAERKMTIMTPREEPAVGYAISGTVGAVLTGLSLLNLDPTALLTIPHVVDDFRRAKNYIHTVPVEE